MTDYLKTIFKLAEAVDDWVEDTDSVEDQGYAREKKVIALLTAATQKLGFDLAEISHPVSYSDDSREAVICIFEHVTLEQLNALASLGNNIRVSACPSHRDVTQIVFSVSEGMETANLSEGRRLPQKRKK